MIFKIFIAGLKMWLQLQKINKNTDIKYNVPAFTYRFANIEKKLVNICRENTF